jgi:hypothetical protein
MKKAQKQNRSKKLKGKDHFGDLGVDEDNIKMNLKYAEYVGVDWNQLAQDRAQ